MGYWKVKLMGHKKVHLKVIMLGLKMMGHENVHSMVIMLGLL